ncbi:hypothetical protein EML15_08805 [Corynebacterium sp. sy017]|uniref:hypothetical protein n=1 Tax=unclassified Corynebacterium TaxID=2624378 RepID=UPI001185B3C0|nr:MULTISPECIES: hypothetical protein [unclassified Corynebacterium]MBP3089243.1 hypothetical protein [Corynebacterium sp. sy017]TSD91050.1 hypothetical protein ELY17_09795 [Corynebacterium sp. SY003]
MPFSQKISNPRLAILCCGILSAFVTLLAQWASRRGAEPFSPSLLMNATEDDPIASYIQTRDPSFRLSSNPEDHYDGVYLWAMAADPFARGSAHDLIDLAAYRYGHPFYAWLIRVCALGQEHLFDTVAWVLAIGSAAAAAMSIAYLAYRLGGSPWWGLLVPMSPGLLFSTTTVLTEPFQVFMLALVLLVYGSRRSRWLLMPLSIAVCLTKEQLSLAILALIALTVWRWLVEHNLSWQRARTTIFALAIGPLSLLCWLVYVRSNFDAQQQEYDSGNIGIPFSGFLGIVDYAAQLRAGDALSNQIGSTTTSFSIALIVVIVVGIIVGLWRRDALGWVVASQLVMMSMLGWRTLVYPHEMFRIPAMTLVFFALMLIVHLPSQRGGAARKVNT